MTGDSAASSVAGSVGGTAGERQVPFYCPYCGDEALRPAGAQGGHWNCESCARGFVLRFTGVLS